MPTWVIIASRIVPRAWNVYRRTFSPVGKLNVSIVSRFRFVIFSNKKTKRENRFEVWCQRDEVNEVDLGATVYRSICVCRFQCANGLNREREREWKKVRGTCACAMWTDEITFCLVTMKMKMYIQTRCGHWHIWWRSACSRDSFDSAVLANQFSTSGGRDIFFSSPSRMLDPTEQSLIGLHMFGDVRSMASLRSSSVILLYFIWDLRCIIPSSRTNTSNRIIHSIEYAESERAENDGRFSKLTLISTWTTSAIELARATCISIVQRNFITSKRRKEKKRKEKKSIYKSVNWLVPLPSQLVSLRSSLNCDVSKQVLSSSEPKPARSW